MAFELGITSFVETTPLFPGGEVIAHDERIREVLEEIQLADKLGLDVYGVGEHHRSDYAASSPEMILAAAAGTTKNIQLTSAVNVLSSDDPVRLYQRYATLDALSNGRAEIMVGRGSFTESFPLFGRGLEHYEELFEENLELLMKIRDNEIVNWNGQFRTPLQNVGIYPRTRKPLPIIVGTGGNVESSIRAARLGLSISYAIIGGSPSRFAPLVALYRDTAKNAGYDVNALQVSTHSHGYIAETDEQAFNEFFPSFQHAMNVLGKERGWRPYDVEAYDEARSIDGALYVGSPEYVAEKIIKLYNEVGIDRFMLHLPIGSLKHEDVMKSIELYATKVAPLVREAIARQEEENK